MNYIPLFFLLFCHRCSIYRHSAHLRLRRRPSGGAASTPWHPALHRRLPLLLPSPQLQEPQQSRHPLLRLDRVLKVCKSLPVNPLPDREKSDILIFWHFDIWITTIFTAMRAIKLAQLCMKLLVIDNTKYLTADCHKWPVRLIRCPCNNSS